MSSTISSLDLFVGDIIERCLVFFEEGLVEVMSRDLAETLFRMRAIPGSQRYERTSLDACILECFRRLLGPSCIVVVSSFDLGLGLGEEILVTLFFQFSFAGIS